jgi:hypothetical protein
MHSVEIVHTNVEGYIAELVMEITVFGASRNVIHRNIVLIRACDPHEAYEKATQLGFKGETSYKNPDKQSVAIKFRGISKLDATYEEIGDRAELTFEEQVGVSNEEIERLIQPKEKLRVFVPPQPGRKHDPDCRSKQVMELAIDRAIGKKE